MMLGNVRGSTETKLVLLAETMPATGGSLVAVFTATMLSGVQSPSSGDCSSMRSMRACGITPKEYMNRSGNLAGKLSVWVMALDRSCTEVKSVTPIISAETMAPARQGVRDQASRRSSGRSMKIRASSGEIKRSASVSSAGLSRL